jgi:hypothetical protein
MTQVLFAGRSGRAEHDTTRIITHKIDENVGGLTIRKSSTSNVARAQLFRQKVRGHEKRGICILREVGRCTIHTKAGMLRYGRKLVVVGLSHASGLISLNEERLVRLEDMRYTGRRT